MAASVLFSCGLNEQTLPSLVHISEESNADGSFLISSILGQRLRISNAGILLVCLQNSYQHYFNAGLRLGYNSNLFLGKTLNKIDLLAEIEQNFINSSYLSNERQLTSTLLADINNEIQSLVETRINTTILIDNLSVLFDLGATTEEILELSHELSLLPEKYKNLSVITKLNNCEIYHEIDRNIAKRSNIHIHIEKLKSGIFREVDGKLHIKRFGSEGSCKKEVLQKEILYKVNDRNIKLYTPGEIGIKV